MLSKMCALPFLVASAVSVSAQQSDLPDVSDLNAVSMAFDGQTSVQVPSYADFDLRNGMTLETWIAPNWLDDLSYDPCILTLMTGQDTVLSVTIGSGRDHIGLLNGPEYLTLPAELNAEELNHLVVVTFGGNWEVFLNGTASGLIAFPASSGRVETIDVGGCGQYGPSYVGWMSNLRVWNAPLNLIDVLEFLPVTDNLEEEEHPYWPLLRAWMLPGLDGEVSIATGGEIFLRNAQ